MAATAACSPSSCTSTGSPARMLAARGASTLGARATYTPQYFQEGFNGVLTIQHGFNRVLKFNRDFQQGFNWVLKTQQGFQ
jgi:hypothetical protein